MPLYLSCSSLHAWPEGPALRDLGNQKGREMTRLHWPEDHPDFALHSTSLPLRSRWEIKGPNPHFIC